MQTHTDKTTFSFKTPNASLYGSGGKGPTAQSYVLKMQTFFNFYIGKPHMALDIFSLVVFLSLFL